MGRRTEKLRNGSKKTGRKCPGWSGHFGITEGDEIMGENIRLNDNPFAADPTDGFDDLNFDE